MHKIKRYANRKLYDTEAKQYVTLDKIGKLLREGEEVSVLDNKTGEDITAATVSQILARTKKGQADTSNIMIQLLRKGPGTLVGYGKKYLSLWDRALTMADEEIDRLVERLVKEKEITASEGSRLKKDMLNRADEMKRWIAEKIDQRLHEALDLMNLASREQVSQLADKIEKLTRKVQNLEKTLAKKAKETETLKIEAGQRRVTEDQSKAMPVTKDDLKQENPTRTGRTKIPAGPDTPDLSA